jgi:hypothetical protein
MRVSAIGDLLQAGEQLGQRATQQTPLPRDGLLARLLLLGNRRRGRARIGQQRGCARQASFG